MSETNALWTEDADDRRLLPDGEVVHYGTTRDTQLIAYTMMFPALNAMVGQIAGEKIQADAVVGPLDEATGEYPVICFKLVWSRSTEPSFIWDKDGAAEVSGPLAGKIVLPD